MLVGHVFDLPLELLYVLEDFSQAFGVFTPVGKLLDENGVFFKFGWVDVANQTTDRCVEVKSQSHKLPLLILHNILQNIDVKGHHNSINWQQQSIVLNIHINFVLLHILWELLSVLVTLHFIRVHLFDFLETSRESLIESLFQLLLFLFFEFHLMVVSFFIVSGGHRLFLVSFSGASARALNDSLLDFFLVLFSGFFLLVVDISELPEHLPEGFLGVVVLG